MDPRPLSYIAQACAGEIIAGAGSSLVSRVCTDSRQAREGDLFIAVRGDRFDGHEFLSEVAAKKVTAVMVARARGPLPPLNVPVMVVSDTRAALGCLAGKYRCDFSLPVVAVAGSNGKSTTKELVASVLQQKFSTLRSEASFNNDIGVPYTLLQLERKHQAAVLEVGTNHPGELAPLVAMIQPRFGIITSLGREHLEFFGGLDGVVEEEGALAELLPPDGRLFLNATSDLAERVANRSSAPVVRIGWDAQNDWSVGQVKLDDCGTAFSVRAPRPDFRGEFRVPLLGRHQVLNALFAIAVGTEFGLSAEEVRRGLLACRPLKMRLELWEAHGLRVLDDCYNANADSMLAALETLRDLPCSGHRIAVLGDMAELGAHAADAHAEVGRWVAEWGVHQLVTVGQMASLTARAAREGGLSQVREFANTTEAVPALQELVQCGDMVLLKASRVVGLERVSEALKQFGTEAGGSVVPPAPPLWPRLVSEFENPSSADATACRH